MHNKKKRKKIRAITDAECSRTKVYTEQYQEKGVQHDIEKKVHNIQNIGLAAQDCHSLETAKFERSAEDVTNNLKNRMDDSVQSEDSIDR